MKSKYLIVPYELLDHLKPNDLLILSQLAYLKKSFNTIIASNDFFRIKLFMSSKTVSRSIRNLERLNYIIVHYDNKVKNNTKRTIILTEKTRTIYSLSSSTWASNKTRKAKPKVLEDFLTS